MIDVVNRSVRAIPNWVLYVAGAVPVIWLYVLGFQNALGADPVDAIERNLGLWALWLLIAGLCITPLQRLTPLRLIKLRRPIGVVAFFYVLVHFLTWLVLDVQIPSQIVADIIKRPYVTVGMVALLLLLPLLLVPALVSQHLPLPAPERIYPQMWSFGFFGVFFLAGGIIFRHQNVIEEMQKYQWFLIETNEIIWLLTSFFILLLIIFIMYLILNSFRQSKFNEKMLMLRISSIT